MTDTLRPELRSALMSRIRGSDTKIEIVVRKGLFRLGLRYCLGGRKLPGRPDVVFPKYRVALFVHGCFWHGHSCKLYRTPKTRREFWMEKIHSNRTRDRRVIRQLRRLGWKPIVVRECAIRGKSDQHISRLIERVYSRIVTSG